MHVDQTTDEHIAALVQGGDGSAFGLLIDRYEAKLSRYARRFLAREDDVTDIVQDVFIKAYENIQGFDATLRFSPWIYRIAHNACVNALRSRGRIIDMYDFDTFVSHHVFEDSHENERDMMTMRHALEKGLRQLDPKYREILTLHYFDNMPYKDIADVLQIPMGTVAIRIKRAKDALQATIKKDL